MVQTDNRQLYTKVTLHTLSAPDRGYLSGHFASVEPADDPQNLVNANRQNAQNPGSYTSASAGTQKTLTKTEVKPQRSNNLKLINQLGGLIPPVIKNIKSPACTFTYGGIVPDTVHPQMVFIKGPSKDFYNPTFKSDKTIKSLAQQTTTNTKTKKATIDNVFIPHNTINLQSSDKDTQSLTVGTHVTYNIWDLEDTYYPNNKKECSKYVGPVLDPNYNKGAGIVQIPNDDKGSSIFVSAKETGLGIKRIYPTSKDILYQNPTLIYNTKNDIYKSQTIYLQSGKNCGFGLKFSDFTTTNKSFLNIKIEDKRPQQNTINYYELTIKNTAGFKQTLYYKNPETGNLDSMELQLGDLPKLSQLYFHFVGGLLLIGTDVDPSNWQVVYPVRIGDSEEPLILEHSISEETYVSMYFEDLSVSFQYMPMAFDHTYDILKDPINSEKGLGIFLTNNFRAPKAYSNNISSNGVKSAFDQSIYFGNYTKPIKDFNHPISVYGDARTQSSYPYSTSSAGEQPLGSLSVKNKVSLTSLGYVDGSIYMKVDNDDASTPSNIGTYYSNSSSSQSYNTTATSVNNITVASDSYSTSELLTYINYGDLSEYVLSWSVSVSAKGKNLFHQTKSASITLKNLDNDPLGRKLYDLISRNLLVIRIEAGYMGSYGRYFEGFCTGISLKKTGSDTTFSLTCEDIMTYSLENIMFETPMIINGLAIVRAIDYMVACSGFAPFYKRVPGNSQFNYFGNLKIDPNVVQKPDLIVCSYSDSIMSKITPVAELMFNGKSGFPTMRWDELQQKIIFDSRYNYLDTDFKFTGESYDTRSLVIRNGSNSAKPDWHGLLTGSYTIDVENANLSAGVKVFGILYDGPKYRSTPEAIVEQRVSKELRNLIVNSVDSNIVPTGYVGFRKIKVHPGDKNTLVNETVMNKIFEYEQLITSDTIHSISFNCYVTKPLNTHGRFLINVLSGENTSQTDAYVYEQVEYTFDKENNYITAQVKGVSVIVP